jgi:hypothetical protein
MGFSCFIIGVGSMAKICNLLTRLTIPKFYFDLIDTITAEEDPDYSPPPASKWVSFSVRLLPIAYIYIYGLRLLYFVCSAVNNPAHFLLRFHTLEWLGEQHITNSCTLTDQHQLVALDPNRPSAVLNHSKLYCVPKRHAG